MEPPYSFAADWLNKFHTASEPIQALWLTLGALTVLGVTWLVMRGVRETMTAWRGRAEPRGRLVYEVYEGGEGRVLVWREGEVRAVEADTPLLPPSTPSCPALCRASTS